MNALAKIQEAGFKVSLNEDGSLKIVPGSDISIEQRQFIKANKQRIIDELKVQSRELSAIEKWMRDRGETDQQIIDEIIDRCQKIPEARAYYLKRSVEQRR